MDSGNSRMNISFYFAQYCHPQYEQEKCKCSNNTSSHQVKKKKKHKQHTMPWARQGKIFIRLCTLCQKLLYTLGNMLHFSVVSRAVQCERDVTHVSSIQVVSQSLFPCCLMKILGVVHPSGAFFRPARVQILFRSSSNRFCTGQTHTVVSVEVDKWVSKSKSVFS